MVRLQCKPFQVGLGFYQDIFRLFIGVQGSICVQDFSTLKWLRVISPMSLHFHLESPGGSKPSELDFTIGRDFSPKLKHVDPLNLPLELNVDKTSLLALHYAVTKMLNNLWGPRPKLDRVLKWRSNRSRALRKLRYVIENRTGRVVWFGQHASPESVRGVRARSARLSIKITRTPTLKRTLKCYEKLNSRFALKHRYVWSPDRPGHTVFGTRQQRKIEESTRYFVLH